MPRPIKSLLVSNCVSDCETSATVLLLLFLQVRYNKNFRKRQQNCFAPLKYLALLHVSGLLTGAKYVGEPCGFVGWVIKTYN